MHYFLSAESLGCTIWPGAGIARSQGIPLDTYSPHVNVGPPIPPAAILPTLPRHHHTVSSSLQLPVSAPPTHLD